MGFGFRVTALSLAFSLVSLSSYAYVKTLGAGGLHISWKGPKVLFMAGNPSNRSGLSEQQVFDITTTGLQRWRQAGAGLLEFLYWQGTDRGIYSPNSDYNGLSSIYFASNANGQTFLDPYALAVTQVWYDTGNGNILETDIVLNDNNYTFSANPSDTTGAGSGNITYRAYLGNVITHEIGHAYGINHSSQLQSTMYYVEAPQQHRLSCDDIAAVRGVYQPDHGARGSIRGRVTYNGGAVFGAQVHAISRSRGTVMGSALTDTGGNYSIDGIEPGTYFLMAEPYYPGASALPQYYAGVNSRICPGGVRFSRTMLTSNGFVLSEVSVPTGSPAYPPTIAVACNGNGSAAIAGVAESKSEFTAPTVLNVGANPGGGFGVADRFSGTNSLYYRIEGLQGDLRVQTVAYGLYSPSDTSVTLLDSGGNTVPASVVQNGFSGDSGYRNFDAILTASGLPYDNYTLRVQRSPLSSSYYPGGALALDSAPFVVVTGVAGGVGFPLSGEYATNQRCESSDHFGAYRSPAGDPIRFDRGNRDDDDGGGFCGTIAGPGGSPPSPGAIAGWFLPWVLMLGFARYFRRLAGCLGRQTPVA